MSVPPSPTPPHNPTISGYTHHMHHLGSLQGLHPNFDSKAIPGAPGQAGYHHYDHHRWNRQFQRGYQRAPIRTKVLWVSSRLFFYMTRVTDGRLDMLVHSWFDLLLDIVSSRCGGDDHLQPSSRQLPQSPSPPSAFLIAPLFLDPDRCNPTAIVLEMQNPHSLLPFRDDGDGKGWDDDDGAYHDRSG
jgi:hypothetical protein